MDLQKSEVLTGKPLVKHRWHGDLIVLSSWENVSNEFFVQKTYISSNYTTEYIVLSDALFLTFKKVVQPVPVLLYFYPCDIKYDGIFTFLGYLCFFVICVNW